MNRFERVVQILDNAVGGPNTPVSFHGAFWRGVTRDVFVAKVIYQLPLIKLGNGAASNLVKALKGEDPFGSDLEVPPPNAFYNRMPSGRPPVPAAEIAFIEKWIDDGCPEDALAPVDVLSWRPTNAPVASSRTDDIWFHTPDLGWAVNSDGNIIHTADGGANWTVQHSAPGVYLRCVGFANANVGWVGTLTRTRRLFHTTDGGAHWNPVLGLPALAPVAVCGISVVNDQVVYASGTNRPSDVPRMMKTVDGGATWTAWDMSAHASILIDTYFTDALHGWVVGGKAHEPTPTTRDKLKPVVLETDDGGATWVNRLAGQEAQFPFGEWGWKIFFVNANVGFVSLENFDQGAILRTDDGGTTWKRLKVNDPQGNANLEGIGFIDTQRGWVGGWGSRDFSKGYSSATFDGGANWQNANEIGRFINRFRFFGNPVFVGYASGDTVYKYTSGPVATPALGLTAAGPTRTLLPVAQLETKTMPVSVPLNVPAGTKRLTLQAWDRFGVEVGVLLDEVHPTAGDLVFRWDGLDRDGKPLEGGDYILRAIADDQTASSILTYRPGKRSPAFLAHTARFTAAGAATAPKAKTVAQLMSVAPAARDLNWLKDSLQIAIQLELTTLPPYLTARWTIVDDSDPVADSIFEIRGEEMLHFELACNMLVAIGGTPWLTDESVVPKYPGPLPGGVLPGLTVGLKKLSTQQAEVFMKLEHPQFEPLALAPTYNSIGEFYSAILQAFQDLSPPLAVDRQIVRLSGGIGKLDTLEKVEAAIELISVQGEGSEATPEETPGDLSHYYRFGEIFHQHRLIKNAAGQWSFTGDPFPLPVTHDMADIPMGGYQQADVPDPAVWDLIVAFDREYSSMLSLLQEAWATGKPAKVTEAVGAMRRMSKIGRELVTKPKPDGSGNYGPCFRYVP